MLTGTTARKRSLGKLRCRWKQNIIMGLKEIGINSRNWLIRLRIGIIGEAL